MGMVGKVGKDDIRRLASVREKLEAEKEPYIRQWRELSRYMSLSMGGWEIDGRDSRKLLDDTSDIYDNTATEASNLMADGLMGTCFGRSISWFKLAFEDRGLDAVGGNAEWLSEAEKIIYRQLSKSNFYDEARQMVLMGATYGTACMWMENNVEAGMPCFTVLHPRSYLLKNDRFGSAEVMFRAFRLSREDAVEQFGEDNLPDAITRHREDRTEFVFWHYVGPAGRYGISDKGKGEYVSVYWCDGQTDKTVRAEKYEHKPFVAWRWNRDPDGSPYGTQSPGMTQLSNIKTINVLSKDILKKSQMVASPPIKRTEGLIINMRPAGMTDLKVGEDFAPVQVTGDLTFTEAERERVRKHIEDAYYSSYFLLMSRIADKTKTATEVSALAAEQSNIMSAFFNRLATEFLEPVIEFVFACEFSSGRLPDGYSAAEGQTARPEVDFISPMFLLQKQNNAIDQPMKCMAQIASLAQINPDILMKIDWDKLVDTLADGYNVRKEILLDDMTYRKLREQVLRQREAQAQTQSKMASEAAAADVYQRTSRAPEQGSLAEAMNGR